MKYTLKNKNLAFPQPYPRAVRQLATATQEGCDTVGGYTLRKNFIDIMPMPGLQEQLCASTANLVFICGQATAGKAQPYDAKVLTPDGFVTMGSLRPGDAILAPDGSQQTVLQIFEQGVIDVYRLVFDDGATTECCADHLWKVQYKSAHNNYSGWKVERLEDIQAKFRAGRKVAIPRCDPSVVERFSDGGKPSAVPRQLMSFRHAGQKQCRCIMVSGSEHLYVTDDFIVTHNTFAMYLKALQGVDHYGFTAKLISVRLQDSKKGGSMFRDGVIVCGNFGGCQYNASDYPSFVWPQWNSSLQLIHSNFNVDNPQEWEAFQDYAKKVQASLIMVDEATEIKQFKMFAYWFSRNRDSSGMTPQMILSFNPSHEHWTTQMLRDAGYIGDDWFLNPKMIGKVRYWYNSGKTPEGIVWGDSRQEVADRAGLRDTKKDLAAGISRLDLVKSFTVFTAAAADNRELVHATGGQSVANLHAVGAEQRRIVAEGYFGPVENDTANVSRQMIHDLWTNPLSDDETLFATMDVSSGKEGSDRSPMIIWRGLQIIAIEMFHGQPQQMSPWIESTLEKYGVHITNFAYDATGHGYWMQGLTNGIPITANKRPIAEIDAFGNPVTRDDYFNCRSQLIGKTEVMLRRGDISCALPQGTELPYGKNGANRRLIDILFDEINIFASTTRNRKIYYKSKDEYRARFKHSPDIMDALCLRAVFELDARPRKQPQPIVTGDAYLNLYSSYATDRLSRTQDRRYRR